MTVTNVCYFAPFGIFSNVSCTFGMKKGPNIGIYIVLTISSIFALVQEKREMPPAYKQPKVTDN